MSFYLRVGQTCGMTWAIRPEAELLLASGLCFGAQPRLAFVKCHEFAVLRNTPCDAEHVQGRFKLPFPGAVTDLAVRGLHWPPTPLRKPERIKPLCAWAGLTDTGALHRVVVGFQPIRALFKALSTVQVKPTFTLRAEVSGEAGFTVSFTFWNANRQ